MREESEKDTTPADPSVSVVEAAVANAQDGIQSYTHGSRQVTRSSPRTQLEFVQDLELRERRKRFGICLYCEQGGRG